MNNEQTQQADDPSGPGWRDVEVGEILQSSDMLSDGTRFVHTDAAGSRCTWQGVYRRRIEQQAEPEPQPEPQLTPDDPSGDGWRDVEPDEILQHGDMFWVVDHWETTQNVGGKSSMYGIGYRRRIEPQPSPDNLPNEVQVLIDLLRGVQDWSGTRVGDAIDVIEAQLFCRKVGQKNV